MGGAVGLEKRGLLRTVGCDKPNQMMLSLGWRGFQGTVRNDGWCIGWVFFFGGGGAGGVKMVSCDTA